MPVPDFASEVLFVGELSTMAPAISPMLEPVRVRVLLPERAGVGQRGRRGFVFVRRDGEGELGGDTPRVAIKRGQKLPHPLPTPFQTEEGGGVGVGWEWGLHGANPIAWGVPELRQ